MCCHYLTQELWHKTGVFLVLLTNLCATTTASRSLGAGVGVVLMWVFLIRNC